MGRKKYLLYIISIFVLMISSCNKLEEIEIDPSNSETSLSQATRAPTFSPPKITATPRILDSFDMGILKAEIELYYTVDPVCELDLLGNETYQSEPNDFHVEEIDVRFDGGEYWVWEKAESVSHTYTSYIACLDYPCHPKVFIYDNKSEVMMEFYWEGWVSYRPIFDMVWFNDNILAFYQLTSPSDATIVVYDVENDEIIFYWLAGYPCE